MKHVKPVTNATPEWLKAIGQQAKQQGLNKLTMRQIDTEIAAVRRERRKKTPTAPSASK